MGDRQQAEEFVRFQLEQLSVRNAHHEFEAIAFRCAKARISSNVRLATGPVSAGGDQGRDGESFVTDLPSEVPDASGFVGTAATRPWVMACTVQRTGLPAKVLEDLAAIVAPGSQPVERVVYFTVQSLSAGQRHRLERAARSRHHLELQVFTGEDLKVWLVEPDLLWVAQRHLSLPTDLIPDDQPDSRPDWYTTALARYVGQMPDYNYADFGTIRRCLRYATHDADARADLPTWIELLDVYAGTHLDRSPDLAHAALYEIVVATIRGLDSVAGVEPRLSAVVRYALTQDSPQPLEDASVLVTYWATAAAIHVPHYNPQEVADLNEQLREHAAGLLQDTDRAVYPIRTGLLLSVLANLCFQMKPDAYVRLRADARVTDAADRSTDLAGPPNILSTAVTAGDLVDAAAAMGYLSELADLLPSVPVMPTEGLAMQFQFLAPVLAGDPAYSRVCAALDGATARRQGNSAAAEASRDRGMAFYQAGRDLEALHELHTAKARWLNGDTIEGCLLTMRLIAHIYARLNLHLAAKQYAAATATLALQEPASHGRHAAHALQQASEAAYSMGMWLDAAATAHVALLARAAHIADPFGQESAEQLVQLEVAAVTSYHAADRFWPHVRDTLIDALGDTPWALGVPEVAAEVTGFAETEAELVSAQLQGDAFSDAGPTRVYRFALFGTTWDLICANSRDAVLATERLGAAIQIALTDRIAHLPYLLSAHLTVHVSVSAPPDADGPFVYRYTDDGIEARAYLAPYTTRAVAHDDGLDVLGVLGHLLTLIHSTDPNETLQALMDNSGGLDHKLFCVGPYPEIAGFLPTRHYEECAALAMVQVSVPVIPTSAPILGAPRELAPLYDPQEARAVITDRYETSAQILRRTLPTLVQDLGFRALYTELRENGWLDWQILVALANVAGNARNHATAGELQDPARLAAFVAAFRRPEDETTAPLPPSTFSARDLAFGLQLTVGAVARRWGLTLGEAPWFTEKVKDLLERRFAFAVDDVPHDPLVDVTAGAGGA